MLMTYIKSILLGLLLLAVIALARDAVAHGFELEQNSYINPTGFALVSNQPVLDNTDGPVPAPANWNIFTDAFNSSATVDPNGISGGAASYGTYEGFVQQVAGPNGAWTIKSATFNIVSPLYYSNGTGSAAQPASSGTYLQFYDQIATGGSDPSIDPADYPNASPLPTVGNGLYVNLYGTTPSAAGFPVSAEYFHELQKDLYLGAGSTQTYGEYGYAFDVTVSLINPFDSSIVTLTSPTMVDVFGLTDPTLNYDAELNPNGGDFADDAAQSQQDLATEFIYEAATDGPAPVPEPSTFVLAALCVGACGVFGLRQRRTGQLVLATHS